MSTAYLLAWIERGVVRGVGIFSDSRPTTIGRAGFWAELEQASADTFGEAVDLLVDRIPGMVDWFSDPEGDPLGAALMGMAADAVRRDHTIGITRSGCQRSFDARRLPSGPRSSHASSAAKPSPRSSSPATAH